MNENGGHKYHDLIHHTAYAVQEMLSCYRIPTALAFNQRKPETAPALRRKGWAKTIPISYVNTRIFISKTEKKNKWGRGLSQMKTNPPGVEFVIIIFKFNKRKKRESHRRVFTLSMWGSNSAISCRRGAVPTKKCTKTCAALGKVAVLLI